MVTRLGPGREFDLIRSYLDAGGAKPGPAVRVGPGDDCAVVTADGVAISVDMVVEDVHFRRAWLEPDEVGYHAAAAALSDLAAMAARPIGVLASVALGPGDEDEAGKGVMVGLAAAAGNAGATVLGGDLTRSPGPLVVDVTAVGEAPMPIRRAGAEPGHDVWVTGHLGAAAAAVEAWLAGREPDPAARSAFAHPTPRTREALWLAGRGVPSAMVDLSDGIAGDAGHLAAASGVRIVVVARALPLAPAAAAGDGIRLAAAGGEDYELCFTAPVGAVEEVREAFEQEHGVPLTRVGHVEAGAGAVILDDDGEPLVLEGFQHWNRP